MSVIQAMTTQDRQKQAVYTLVVGLGKTGLSVVAYLSALGEKTIVVDSRDIPPGLAVLRQQYPDVTVVTGEFKASLFLQAHRIIVSPGVPLSTPVLQQARSKAIEICGDIDLFAHEVSVPVLGITGSNGKSTVTSLLTQMINDAGMTAVAGGNIGLPVLDMLANAEKVTAADDTDVDNGKCYILELSSFQLETLNHLTMKAAVVLNISADHMDRYENLAAYACSKQRIYEQAEILVINVDDKLAAPVSTANRKVIGFTLFEPDEKQFGVVERQGNSFVYYGDQCLISAEEIRLKGRHNLQNALAALSMGMATGLPVDSMLETLKTFSGLAHRTQWVAEINGVQWFNDSKATNAGAAIAAIKGLSGRHVLIAGGEAKGADFTDLASVIVDTCRAVILLGKDAVLLQQNIEKAVMTRSKSQTSVVVLPVKRVNDMHAAVLAASELAKPGDNVLLAPACASFDMFNSFEHRGDVFMEMVRQLKSGVLQ